MSEPDYQPITLRRVAVLSERVEAIYLALHIALVVIFVGILYALYTVREDILNAMKGNTP